MKNPKLKTVALALFALTFVGCGHNADTSNANIAPTNNTNPETPAAASTSAPTPASESAPTSNTNVKIQTVTMTAKQFTFDPATITVQKGDTVRLSIKSIDVTHGFSLPAFDISETLKPGTITNVEFIAEKAGTFPFSCNVVCGSGHGGMTGTLVVQE